MRSAPFAAKAARHVRIEKADHVQDFSGSDSVGPNDRARSWRALSLRLVQPGRPVISQSPSAVSEVGISSACLRRWWPESHPGNRAVSWCRQASALDLSRPGSRRGEATGLARSGPKVLLLRRRSTSRCQCDRVRDGVAPLAKRQRCRGRRTADCLDPARRYGRSASRRAFPCRLAPDWLGAGSVRI